MKKQIFLFALTVLFAGISSVSDGVTKPSLLLKAGDPAFVEVQKVPVVDCRVVRGFLGTPVDGSVKSKDYRGRVREYPHTASDGVVYSYNRNDGIHITLKDDKGFDMVVLRGGAKANLYTDVTGLTEPDAGVLYTFVGDRETETVLFDRRVRSKRISVFGVKEGEAADISFYRVEKRRLKFASMGRWTAGGEVALPEPKSEFASQSVYRAMRERYPEGERRVLKLVRMKGKGEPVEAKSRQAVHFISPPFEGDGTRVGEALDRNMPGGLFGLSLDMVLSGAAGPISFTVAVQDPLNPRLDLTWVEFTVEKPGRVRIALDVPDQVLLEGSRLWVTYLHDVFTNNTFRSRWLRSLGWNGEGEDIAKLRMAEYDRLADAVEEAVEWSRISQIVGLE